MSKTQDIDEGHTLDLLIPAFFVALVGGFAALLHISFTVLLLGLAVCMVSMRSGVEIDVQSKRIRVYKALFRWKVGRWVDLQQFEHVRLRVTSESQVMHARSITNTHRVKTYDLVFRMGKEDQFEFHDFSTYPLAYRALAILVKELNFSYDDDVEARKKHARDHEVRRRR